MQQARIVLLAGIVFLWMNAGALGGDLEPAAPPGPTMKTLDQIEPRIPIPAATAELPAGPYVIDTAGAYYLEGDRYCSNDGIQIDADHVTIDLMGYKLAQIGTGTADGISSSAGSNIEICNGTIQDFTWHGIKLQSSSNVRIVNVRVISNGSGIITGANAFVRRCFMAENSGWGITLFSGAGSIIESSTVCNNGNIGIDASAGISSSIINNTVHGNGGRGIRGGNGSTLIGNAVYQNGDAGILTGAGSVVVNNSVHHCEGSGIEAYDGATVSENAVYHNTEHGIDCSFGTVVKGNSVYLNGNWGIYALNRNTITNNTVALNNLNDDASFGGIHIGLENFLKENNVSSNNQQNIAVQNSSNAIEGNLVTGCTSGPGYGIVFVNTGNVYANNRLSGNTDNLSNETTQTDGGGNIEF